MPSKFVIVLSFFLIISIGLFAEGNNDGDSQVKQENILIEIHHCPTCGFRSTANKLAEELKAVFGVEVKLVDGEIGSFDVFVNGELIFSKSETGRFPNPGEIVQKINDYKKD